MSSTEMTEEQLLGKQQEMLQAASEHILVNTKHQNKNCLICIKQEVIDAQTEYVEKSEAVIKAQENMIKELRSHIEELRGIIERVFDTITKEGV
jgi:hypothetical protein